MATTKKEATGNPMQGHRTIDLRDDVVAIDEVARRLHIPKTTLYGWRYRGKGPQSHRVGKHLRYRWSEVLEWLDGLD